MHGSGGMDPVGRPRRVQERVIGADPRQRRDEDGERRHVPISTERLQLGAVDGPERRHLGDGADLREPSGDLATHGGDGLDAGDIEGRSTRRVHVLDRDPSIGSGTGDRREIDPPFLRELANRRRGRRLDRRRRASGPAAPTSHLERHQRRPDRHRSPADACIVAILPANGEGISTVGLRRLDLDDRLVELDRVAFRDQPGATTRPPRAPRRGPAGRRRCRPSVGHRPADRVRDPSTLGRYVLLERGRRVRHVRARHARHRGLEVVERLLHRSARRSRRPSRA